MSRRSTVVVVGGGVTGTGIARDLAMRGVEVTLVERGRLADGTTGRMHGLLHSGARYAVSDPASAEQCIGENETLRDIASHCVEETGGLFVSLDTDDPAYFREKRAACKRAGIPVETVSGEEARRIEPALTERVERALLVPDAAIDPFRLVVANAASAEEHGAEILTGTEVTEIRLEEREGDGTGKRVAAVTIDTESDTVDIEADHVVNAAGPWVGTVLESLDVEVPLSPSKGAMAVTDSRPVDTVINRCRPKGEGDILVPHETTAILGTTDVPIEDPDTFEETEAEIELLVEELSEMVPGLEESRLIRTYWGVRPLFDPDRDGDSTGASRDFAVLDHETRDGVAGLTTVVGGKLTTYRLMAEETADHVAERVDVDSTCQTAAEPLPGSRGEVDFRRILENYDLRSPIAARSTARLGDRTEEVLDNASNPVVCECEGVTEAEIRDAIQSVGPDLGAVRMRTRATMGTCQGGMCAHRLAIALVATSDQENHETVWAELDRLLAERWTGQRFVLDDEQLSQVRLNQTLWHLALNLPAGFERTGRLGLDDRTDGPEFDQRSFGPEFDRFDDGRSGF